MSVPKLLSNDSTICNCLPNFIVLKTEIGLSSVRGNWVYHLAENALQLVYLFFSLPAPPIIKFTITIMSCLLWTIAVYGRDMASDNPILSPFPHCIRCIHDLESICLKL